MKRKPVDYLLLGGIAGVIVIIDQITKAMVRTNIPMGGFWAPWSGIIPFIQIYHTENTGVAFGMFQGGNLIFSVLALLVSIAIIYYYPRVPASDWTLRIALGLQLGGALGNLVDRVVFGYVTDFIALSNFAIFNVADSSITIGVVVLLLGVWAQEQKKDKTQPVEPPVGPLGNEEAGSDKANE